MREKRIAKIYFEARVFLTKKGELYGYAIQEDGKPHCSKLTAKQKIAFWEGGIFEQGKQILTIWSPVATAEPMQSIEIKFLKHQER